MRLGLLPIPAVLYVSQAAWAQAPQEVQRFSAERLSPATTAEGVADVESAQSIGQGGLDVAFWLNFAKSPVLLYQNNGEKSLRRGPLVRDRLSANLIATYAIMDWLELAADLPVILYQARPTEIAVDGGAISLAALSASGIGDVRVQPKLRLLRVDQVGFDLATTFAVGFPTAEHRDYRGEDGFTFAPTLVLSRSFPKGMQLAANLGYQVRPRVDFLGTTLDDELIYRVAYAHRLLALGAPAVRVGVALAGSLSARQPLHSTLESPLEVLAEVQADLHPSFELFAGGGGGLIHGVRTPVGRAFFGLRYLHRDRDQDGDGIRDGEDLCPTEAEDVDGTQDLDGCPDPEPAPPPRDPDSDADGLSDLQDQCPHQKGTAEQKGCPDCDKDGIIDSQDRCPTDPEDRDAFQDEDGCPDPDHDGDGINNEADRCPDQAGPKENQGCPDSDRDGDGVADRVDNCPDEPGTSENRGCKQHQLVAITSERLIIEERVYFRTGSAVILPRSFPLLKNVADVIKAHAEIASVVVEGHTDNVGGEKLNQRLSQKRAEAVRAYLIRQGVGPLRLSATGFGMTRPIAPNDTEEGRSTNRRVEFVVPPGPTLLE